LEQYAELIEKRSIILKKSILTPLLFGAFLSLTSGQQTVDPTWIQATPSAPFSPRFDPCTVVFNSKLWVIGGSPYSGPATKDIWSSADGQNWERVTNTATCLPRQGHTALVFKGKLWVIAGATQKGGSVFYSRSDVWSSADGTTWDQVTDSAAFPSRVYHASTVFDGKMWVLGGVDTRKVAKKHGDAWYSEDGSDWKLATASAFTPRAFPKAVTYQNKIWVLGGNNGGLLKDIISSPDGINWTAVQSVTGFNPADHFFLSTTYNSQVWVHDRFTISKTTDMINWSTVTTTGPYARLGLLELDSKLWSIGSLTQGSVYVHPVYHYTAGPPLPKRIGSK
jgi:hypothetical protein